MYDRAPFIATGEQKECLAGWSAITSVLREEPGPLCIECYPGVLLDEVQHALAEYYAGLASHALPGTPCCRKPHWRHASPNSSRRIPSLGG